MNEVRICVERRAKSQRNPSRNGGDVDVRSCESSLCPGWLRRREGVDCEAGTTPGGPSLGTCVDGGGMVRLSELRAERTSVRRWAGVDECSGSERQRAHNLLEWWIYMTVESTPCRLSLVCYTIAHLLRVVVGLRETSRRTSYILGAQ